MGRFPKFSSCFCYDLEAGSELLGIFEIVIGAIVFILCLVFYSVYIEALSDIPNIVWLVLAIVSLIRIFIYAYWMHGIHKKRPAFLLPATVFAVINLLFINPFTVTIVKFLFVDDLVLIHPSMIFNMPHSLNFMFSIVHLCTIVLNMYLFVVQCSLYKQMKKEARERKKAAKMIRSTF
ncbi:uncharacterized protein LOC129577105 [Sitodiplosis mosellana]|uniref:uncharacterized protein LOC129577105 n=1 Tax=Sitodiplosis mosellana TaxID=263140 RepID=UPI00244445F6|nr:uncharacterized protein LOC129577105 [Sitodiplosis mosellana]